MGQIKDILNACGEDVDQAEKQISQLAYNQEEKRKVLRAKLEIAMMDSQKREEIASHLAHIIHLVTKA